MSGYSKMRVGSYHTGKSRSMDLSDLSFPSLAPDHGLRQPSDPAPPPPPPRMDQPSWHQQEGGGGGGEQRSGVRLTRISSSASQRFRVSGKSRSHGGSTLYAVVRRAFSMKKPSSAPSEGYGRIHDSTGDGDDDDEGLVQVEEEQRQQVGSTGRKRGKIRRVCKSLFGF